MTTRRPIVNIAGQVQEIPVGDLVPIAALATGTPDGTKFIRDDGTLVQPFNLPDVLAFAAAQG